jgi:molybdate/tungstate transport system ATP-binding protein
MLRVDHLRVEQGSFCLQGISFEVPDGAYAVLMGRTGSGKTTLLEAICGLRPVSGGTIHLGESPIHALSPGKRGIGLVPQDGALFPTMTVHDQIAFGPTVQNWKRKRISEKVEMLAEAMGITGLLKRRPFGLSGGERQRVALARALAIEPRLLCLDEPLSALDEQTREDMCALLKSLQMKIGFTALHVTHSQSEAQRLGDCVVQMEALRGGGNN